MLKVLVLFLVFHEIHGKLKTEPIDKDYNFLQLHRDNFENVVKRTDKHVIILFHLF